MPRVRVWCRYDGERYRKDRERNAFVYVRLPRDDHAELKRKAAQARVSMGELIRTYITWGLEQEN